MSETFYATVPAVEGRTSELAYAKADTPQGARKALVKKYRDLSRADPRDVAVWRTKKRPTILDDGQVFVDFDAIRVRA